jgi:hypothetical protein
MVESNEAEFRIARRANACCSTVFKIRDARRAMEAELGCRHLRTWQPAEMASLSGLTRWIRN